jgi:uncharacterized protein
VKTLTIYVDDIKEAAQPWEAELSREEIDAMLGGEPPTEYHAAGSCKVTARLTKMGRKVLVQAGFTVPLAGICKRCLKDLTLSEPIELTLTFNPAPETVHAKKKVPAVAAAAGDKPRERHHPREDTKSDGSFDILLADEELYSGKTIDLHAAVREQVLLAAPPSPVCREECKGLCPACGQDLNLHDCGHKQIDVDPRWEALKALQLAETQPKQRKE